MNAFHHFIFSLLALSLVCCSSGPNSYYALVPDGVFPSSVGGFGIGVGPVTVAEYLDRPNLIVAETEHRLGVAENHRWAGDLSSGIARVMAVNLGRRWQTGNTRIYPWRNEDGVRKQIAIDVLRMHGGADGHAILEAAWRVYSLPDRRLVASRTFAASEPLGEDGYDALVAAESRLLARLASDIAGCGP